MILFVAQALSLCESGVIMIGIDYLG
jgi:hypothetical protein